MGEFRLVEGSLPLLISYLFWTSTDFRLFRIFITILTLIAMCGFVFITQAMKRILSCYNIK
jgi:hypothetical protein